MSAREEKIEKERKKQMREGIEEDDEIEDEASGTDEKNEESGVRREKKGMSLSKHTTDRFVRYKG